jgi:uncharacterized protein (TIGR02145 family)
MNIRKCFKGFTHTLVFGAWFVLCGTSACSNFQQDNPFDTKGTGTYVNPVDIDGNNYPTVILGNQIWTTVNLRATRLNDGTPISNLKDLTTWANSSDPAYCFYINTTDTAEQEKWGALYNWYAVNSGKLAPKGWRVPDSSDWATLENYLIANGYNYDGTTTDNKIAKALASQTDWHGNDSTPGFINTNQSANNSSGFSGLPGGMFSTMILPQEFQDFVALGLSARWWSTTAAKASVSVYDFELNFYSTGSHIGTSLLGWKEGLSVRLVKDLN